MSTDKAVDTSSMSKAELQTYIQSLQLKIANQPKPREVTVQLSATTGAIVVSGLSGRFPTTLYRSSWKRLLTNDVGNLILAFIKENDAEITRVMTAAGKSDR